MRYIILGFILLLNAEVFTQTLDISDIDASAFPIIKAKVLAVNAAGEPMSNLKPADFNVSEEGNVRKILSVTCQTQTFMNPVSTILVMDASGSMQARFLSLAKNAAHAWINAMPDGNSECAITAFNYSNFLIQDFTNDKLLLNSKVDNLFASGGTSYNAAFIDEQYGALLVSKNARNQKVIVIMTDGMSLTRTESTTIIEEAKQQNAIIYAVTLGMRCPADLKMITELTGGQWFENVSTKEEVNSIYHQILQFVQGIEACEITWESDITCSEGDRIADIDFYPLVTNRLISYTLPTGLIPGVSLSFESAFFKNAQPGTIRDTIITITANSGDMNVSEIKWANPAFEVNPKSFKIKKGQSQPIKITYTPNIGTNFNWARMEVYNNLCPTHFFVSGGFITPKNELGKIELVHPNGNELFVSGNDTIIKWKGISINDNVKLDYSTDKGVTWSNITSKAFGGKFDWIRIPNTPSQNCLMKVTQLTDLDAVSPDWALKLGADFFTNLTDKHSDIDIDSDGNLYFSSIFSGILKIGNKTLTSKGEEDIFVAKIGSNGKLIWITQIGGIESDYATGIAVDEYGNSFISGKFRNKLQIDTREFFSKGSTDILLAKLLPNGDIEWIKSIGNKGEDFASDVCLDKDGNVIFTGGFSQIVSFGNKRVVSTGGLDVFVAKYSPSGNAIWVKNNGGIFYDEGTSVTSDYKNNILVTGKFSKNAQFGSYLLTANNSDPEYLDNEIFVTKYTSDGSLQWAISSGGSGEDIANSIVSDSKGNVLICGNFNQKAFFGTIEANPSVIEKSDIFVTKISPDGYVDWVRTSGGPGDDYGFGMVIDKNDNIVVSGGYFNSADVGSIKLKSAGQFDVVVASYSSVGNINWVKSAGGLSSDFGRAIALDQKGNAFVAGNYTNASTFGKMVLSTELGYMDAFVWGAGGGSTELNSDISDNLWTIDSPKITATNIDMGQVFVGTVKDSIIVDFIKNTGLYDCKIDKVILGGSDSGEFELLSSIPGEKIQPGSQLNFEFRFKPTKIGISNAEILIITQSDTLKQNIIGYGLKPDILIINRVIDFGKVLLGEQKDSVRVITITNNGSKKIEIKNIKINHQNPNVFSDILGTDVITLQPGDTAKMDLRFSPLVTGKTKGSIEYRYDGIGSPAIVELIGEGINPNPSILVSNNYFDDLSCSYTAESEVQITNKGAKDLVISAIEFLGNNSSDFFINQSLPIVITYNEVFRLRVSFKSSTPGFKNAEMLIKCNSFPESNITVPFSLKIVGAKCIADTYQVSFGKLAVNQASEKNVKFTNIGNQTSLFVLSNLKDFRTEKDSFVLLSGQSIDLKFFFDGSDTENQFDETVTIIDTLCKSEVVVNLSATVVDKKLPKISVSDYVPEVLVCSDEMVKEISISNIGEDELIIYSIELDGVDKQDFEILNLEKMTLAAGESTQFHLKFSPKSSGQKKTNIRINSNSIDSPLLEIPIKMEFEISDFELDRLTIDLGKDQQGTISQFSFIVKNSGSIKNRFIIKSNDLIQFDNIEFTLAPNEFIEINGEFDSGSLMGVLTEEINIIDTICKQSKNIVLMKTVISSAAITIKPENTSAYVGDQVLIPIKISDSFNLNDKKIDFINFDIKFNSTLLSPETNANYTVKNNIGTLSLINIPFKLDDDYVLTKIPFAVGLGNSEFTNIEISNVTVKGDSVGIKVEQGIFKSFGICFEGGPRLINPTGNAGILSVSPNPADKDAVIKIGIIEKDFTIISIYDIVGNLKNQFIFRNEIGTKFLTLKLDDYESGKYYIQFTSPTLNIIKELIIIK